MVFVDSSVWIDFFQERVTPQTEALRSLIRRQQIIIGDLILSEVLQGFVKDRDYAHARRMFRRLSTIEIGGEVVALLASEHYRSLRAQGITVRKTNATLIATRCILNGIELLHSDRGFDPFAEHLGLQVYAPAPGVH